VLQGESKERRILQMARHERDDRRSGIAIEDVALDHHRRPGLAVIARRSHRHDIPAAH
jgi:hypothetical protein